MAFVGWSDGGMKRLVWLVEMDLLDNTDTDTTLYLCDRHGPGEFGWTDPADGTVYRGYVEIIRVVESTPWQKDLAKGAWPAPNAAFTLSCPTTAGSFGDPETVKTILTGRPYNREVRISVVEVDEDGAELAREQVFRGVTANRKADSWSLDPDGGRILFNFRAVSYGGAFTREIPLDSWVTADASAANTFANARHNGTTALLLYAGGTNVASANRQGDFWVQVPMLESDTSGTPNTVLIGIASHAVDENPVSGTGQWLTTDASVRSGLRKTTDSGEPNSFVSSTRTVTSTYPKMESGWLSDSSTDAFVLSVDTGSERWTNGLNLWAKIWGKGSDSGVANAIVAAEDVIWDAVTNVGGVNDFFDFSGPSTGISDSPWTADERRISLCVPGVKLTKELPKLGEVIGEICGFLGMGISQDHDAANGNELRGQWFFRTWSQSDEPDHAWTLFSGLMKGWKVKHHDWLQGANNVTVEGAERASSFQQPSLTVDYEATEDQASDTSRVVLHRPVYSDVDTTAETDDGATIRKTISYKWLGPHSGTGTIGWEDQAAALIGHLGKPVAIVECEFHTGQGWATRLGHKVLWEDFPAETADNLPGGPLGQVWERRIEVTRTGVTSTIKVAHADLQFS